MGGRALFGRRVIYTDVAAINDNNIIDVSAKGPVHSPHEPGRY